MNNTNKILDGKYVSQLIKDEIKQYTDTLDLKPKLVVIQIGNNPASNVYINNKQKACENVGITFEHIKYEENIDEDTITNKIQELNNEDTVNGILIQLPLPNHLDSYKIINTIKPNKDVDGLTDYNLGKLIADQDCFISCTPLGVIELLKYYKIDIKSKNVVIVGRSKLVGKPLFHLFLKEDATVTTCHRETNNLKSFTKNADILAVAVGYKDLITEDMVKEDAIIVDVGINKIDKKLYGDVDFENIIDKAKMITPVPGGVGPMTISMLLKNIIKSYNLKNDK